VIGAIDGFLSSAAPELKVQTEARFGEEKSFHADLLVSRGEEKVVVELKRRLIEQHYWNAVAQVAYYLNVGDIMDGILLFLPDGPSEMERLEAVVKGTSGRLVVLSPVGSNPGLNRAATGHPPVTSADAQT
jgi:hypothetical protein